MAQRAGFRSEDVLDGYGPRSVGLLRFIDRERIPGFESAANRFAEVAVNGWLRPIIVQGRLAEVGCVATLSRGHNLDRLSAG